MKIGKIKQTKHFHGNTNYNVKGSGFTIVATATMNALLIHILPSARKQASEHSSED